jgi:hypothetical protein
MGRPKTSWGLSATCFKIVSLCHRVIVSLQGMWLDFNGVIYSFRCRYVYTHMYRVRSVNIVVLGLM